MCDRQTAVGELTEVVRQKIESIRTISPCEGWEEYYRGRLSAFEEVEAMINSLKE